jgi:hypothetical protein
MAGRLTEQAYLRASEAAGQDEEAQTRWMLVFDRMARGLRLSIALEAKLSRERRRDADEIAAEIANDIEPEARGGRREPPKTSSCDAEPCESAPCESDREGDDDGLAGDAPIAQRIGRLKAIVEGAGAPEPAPPLHRAERQALAAQRAWRAHQAATRWAPDEPWDILTATDRVADDDPPWRGAG